MADWPILTALLLVPLFGALLILTIRGDSEQAQQNIRYVALFTTLAELLLAVIMWGMFDVGEAGFQLVESHAWIGENIRYKMGVDGISMLFIVLSAFLMPLCILASWQSITKRVKDYMIAFLVMESLMVGVFGALDIFLFYLSSKVALSRCF
ncbi:hypothetical protein JCM17845_20450 [Iodidimonas gelatinilytica]|uniref:NADH:ubiquinone oxidoreductase chain 4 N-terminal domain-containing protein n=1 Tax=Iodidimonas gelatinilytica TaxID=1236966 RepID=A0A5A7MZI1_9PROT|nr:hypothetical protein [Iodidimonas gelatinilytica]GER01422.1 hypothetical protein JCM17845_20450 [Iodidimonas gelatinilytica]